MNQLIEPLELRRLLDGASLDNGFLFVEGSNANDDIRLRIRDGELIVDLTRANNPTDTFRFDASAVL